MKKFLLFTICVVVAMAFAVPSHAQRIIPKQKGVEITGSIPIIKGEKLFGKNNFGAGISITRYMRHANYAFISAEYEQQNMPYRNYGVKLKDAIMQLGYMHPILSDNGKNVFLYGGISAIGGYDEINEDKKLLPDGATLLDRSRFVYGSALHSSMELFITDNLLFVIKAQGRFLFGSDLHRFRPALSVGLRFNF